jgi:osmotically-inducible protein OsmY
MPLTRIVLLLALASGAGATACARTIDTPIHDAAITAAVQTALLNAPSVDGARVDVRTHGGVVYLSGVLASDEEASCVQAIVRSVRDVREVESGLATD